VVLEEPARETSPGHGTLEEVFIEAISRDTSDGGAGGRSREEQP